MLARNAAEPSVPLFACEQADILQKAIKHNRFVAEPHVLLAQIHYRTENFGEAVIESRVAITKFYTLGCCWDKRMP